MSENDSHAANDLLGLFAPPPPKRSQLPSLFTPPSETDPLLFSTQLDTIPDITGKISISQKHKKNENRENIVREDTSTDNDDEDDDLTTTVRTINSRDKMETIGDHESKGKTGTNGTNIFSEPNGGREFFKKSAAASAAGRQQHGTNAAVKKADSDWKFQASNLRTLLASLLAPFGQPSTWTGGILFVLYHVVFCMANGGSITRPYSGGSLLGDMARYTALGIIVSCPFLVYSLSDMPKRVGIPAMYPSADLFLAPFLAEAAAIIDKTIMDDWNSGLILGHDNNNNNNNNDIIGEDDELFLTRLWFGSFALVVSFGMFAAGSLLILASKIKLANLGTYLPYGVLCGFFSSVGILMWKLAITIDTPTDSYADKKPHWKVVLTHHLPSLLVGIAMNQLGPKHPFFVTGLIILTVGVFYGVMLAMGISREEAQRAGWFYSHEELQSTSSYVYSSLSSDIPGATNVDDTWFYSRLLPPSPFGTWVAFFGKYVHWRAVSKGATHMVALAILYLLRSSIHATALKKNIHNLIRRVPVENSSEEKLEDLEIASPMSPGFSSPPRGHRRIDSAVSVASQLAQSLRAEVRIVNLSLADPQSLGGKCYINSPCRPSNALRMTSIGSTTTAVAANNNNLKKRRSISMGSEPTVMIQNISGGGDRAPPVPPQNPFRSKTISETKTLLLPTTRREISALTQRTVSPRAVVEPLSPEHKKASRPPSPIGADKKRDLPVKYSVDYVEIHAPSTDLTLEDIFVQYGYGLFVTGAFGGFGCCPTIATSNTMYAIGAGKAAPQYFSVILLLVAFYSSGFELVRFIPKAAFSSLLVLSAVDNTVTWFIEPLSKMDNLIEWSVIPFITMFSLLVGFLNAVILGIGVSTFLFVADFFRVGVVKYDASGLEIRSRIERSLVESVWLDTHGDNLRVLVLQNYLFFGNASSVYGYIETMFEEIPLAESIRLEYPIPPKPLVLVLDLSLITGMDTSAVDVFMDIWRVCKSNDCKLYLCGLSPRLKKTFAKGGMRPDTKGARKSRTLLYFSDLDHGLGRAEDVLIDRDMGDFANQSLFQLEKGSSGFHVALQHIDQLHSTNMAEGLLGLEPHTTTVTLQESQILYERDGGVIKECDHGLFFIESGMIREDDGRSHRTNTRTGGSFKKSILKGNDDTLTGKHARLDTAAQRASLIQLASKETTHNSNNLRIATAGPGWVVGANEFATGRHSMKKFKAITKIKMHHLRFSDLAKIEQENPALVLRLYKMLTHVMARKEEDTVAHLSTLHDILSSPAHSKPVSRLSLGALSNSSSDFS
eukprot:CAMPEP_0116086564 /NCGR_PEP_ID=MMETSP0327-20121206/4920_1 /TAXON_ID=44447 /ORGANISM="Pseudo-nitzschia delicatissima, Strain B596" /LENGTH=1288 /DNA_ID=CAMNT_0003577619 /DNA_START=153 /DNA_END=4019 /DNA_ORIENTATION=-